MLYNTHNLFKCTTVFLLDNRRKPQGTKDAGEIGFRHRLWSPVTSSLGWLSITSVLPLVLCLHPQASVGKAWTQYSKEPSRPPSASAPSSVPFPESPPPWEVLASPALDPFLWIRCWRHHVKDRGASLHFLLNWTAGPLAQHFLPGPEQLTAKQCMSP